MSMSIWDSVLNFLLCDKAGIHPPDMAFAAPLTEKEQISAVRADYRADIDAGRVDWFSQVHGFGPSLVFFSVADIEIIRTRKNKVAAVRSDERHSLVLIGVDRGAKVYRFLPIAIHTFRTINIAFAMPIRKTGAEVNGVLAVYRELPMMRIVVDRRIDEFGFRPAIRRTVDIPDPFLFGSRSARSPEFSRLRRI